MYIWYILITFDYTIIYIMKRANTKIITLQPDIRDRLQRQANKAKLTLKAYIELVLNLQSFGKVIIPGINKELTELNIEPEHEF